MAKTSYPSPALRAAAPERNTSTRSYRPRSQRQRSAPPSAAAREALSVVVVERRERLAAPAIAAAVVADRGSPPLGAMRPASYAENYSFVSRFRDSQTDLMLRKVSAADLERIRHFPIRIPR